MYDNSAEPYPRVRGTCGRNNSENQTFVGLQYICSSVTVNIYSLIHLRGQRMITLLELQHTWNQSIVLFFFFSKHKR